MRLIVKQEGDMRVEGKEGGKEEGETNRQGSRRQQVEGREREERSEGGRKGVRNLRVCRRPHSTGSSSKRVVRGNNCG